MFLTYLKVSRQWTSDTPFPLGNMGSCIHVCNFLDWCKHLWCFTPSCCPTGRTFRKLLPLVNCFTLVLHDIRFSSSSGIVNEAYGIFVVHLCANIYRFDVAVYSLACHSWSYPSSWFELSFSTLQSYARVAANFIEATVISKTCVYHWHLCLLFASTRRAISVDVHVGLRCLMSFFVRVHFFVIWF